MDLTEERLVDYIETFNDAYLRTANKYLPFDILDNLSRYEFINKNIIGYISTQFGAGFEYLGIGEKNIKINKSRERIEDAFLKPHILMKAMDPGILIRGSATLGSREIGLDYGVDMMFPFLLEGDKSSLKMINCIFRYKVLGWERKVKYAELYGSKSNDNWSKESAIQRAMEEIFIAHVDYGESQRRSMEIGEYLDNFKKNTVIILGDYGKEGRKRLERIKSNIGRLGYTPILVDEIQEYSEYNLIQKVVAIASVSRFVIIDDSSKSGHLFELKNVIDNQWITIVLRNKDNEGTFMSRGLSTRSKIIIEKEYTEENMDEVTIKAISWAEEKIKELEIEDCKLYPWRRNK